MMEFHDGEYQGGFLAKTGEGDVVAAPGAMIGEDSVVTALQNRAMIAMNAGRDEINHLLPDVDAALVEASVYHQNNPERWCKLFELKAILHGHLQSREGASEYPNFGKTLKDYFKEACEHKKLNFLKSILKFIKLRQAEKYPSVIRVDNVFIKTVLDASLDSHNFDVALMILENFSEVFKGYISSEISKKCPEVALDFYGRISDGQNNIPAFVVAAREGDVSVVNYCLGSDTPPDLNACDGYMPALHAAVENGREIVVRLLLQAGADINLTYQGRTALSMAMCGNNSVLVGILLSDKKFDWLKNKHVIDLVEIYLTSSNDREAAKKIVQLILESLASIEKHTVMSEMLMGETPLSFAIPLDREVAGILIERGIGVFDQNAQGDTPSYCIAQARDEGLMSELKSYYARHCSQITTLFLNSDSRVCQKLPEQSSCTLVLPLVNNWLELKQGVFNELSHRVNSAHTTCAELRKIRDQINNPKGPLMQFLGIGHGSHFWQSASPWPKKLAPLLDIIQARVVQAYSVVLISNKKK